jgi:hypothetical protein
MHQVKRAPLGTLFEQLRDTRNGAAFAMPEIEPKLDPH